MIRLAAFFTLATLADFASIKWQTEQNALVLFLGPSRAYLMKLFLIPEVLLIALMIYKMERPNLSRAVLAVGGILGIVGWISNQ